MGCCPIGKFVFSHTDALRYKSILQGLLNEWGVEFVDLEGVLEDGLVRDQSHVDVVVEHFRRAGVDCLFMPHCNFGTEGAVGMIARKLDLPVLLWGPRDEAPPAGRHAPAGYALRAVRVEQGSRQGRREVQLHREHRVRRPGPAKRRDTFLRAVAMAANRKLGGCSKGMKRKRTIAAGLVHSPPIQLMDEPTTGIDVASARQIRQLIDELNAAGTMRGLSRSVSSVGRNCSQSIISFSRASGSLFLSILENRV